MNVLSILSFLAAVVYAGLGLNVLRHDERADLNRLFAVLCAAYAAWSFCYVFLYPAPDERSCWLWFRLSAIGWTQFSGLTLHFTLKLTRNDRVLKQGWIYPVMYGPGLIFLVRAWTGVVTVERFQPGPLGWYPVEAVHSPWFWLFTAFYLVYVLVSIGLTWAWGRRSRLARERKQSAIITGSTAAALLLGAVSNNALPALEVRVLPSLAHIIIIVWLAGIWIAIIRYKLMTLTSSIAAEEILNKTREMVLLLDPSQRIIRTNPRTTYLLGFSPEELYGRTIESLCCFGTGPLRGPGLLAESSDTAVDLAFMRKEGDPIPVSVAVSRIRDDAGDLIGTVIFARDLRQSRQLQREIAERKLVESALSRSENQYRVIFESTGTVIAIIHEDSTINLVNSEFEKASGYSKAEVEGRMSWKSFVHPDELPRMEEYERLRRESAERAPRGYETRMLDRRGNVRHVFVTVARIPDTPESIVSVLDIHDRIQAEKALRESHEKLQEVDRMKTDFLSIVAHELRTPLTSVLGFAKIIRNKFETILVPELPEDDSRTGRAAFLIRDNLRIIVDEANRLTSLINDVLDLAKLEAGKIDWEVSPVSVPDLLERAKAATSTLAAQKNLDFTVETEPGLPEVRADDDRLMQVMVNLISNAVKFTREGFVACRARRQDDEVVVSVQDSGMGLRKEDFSRVFEKFRQVGDTVSGIQFGTGLGLPICRQIVEHFGGRIWVESELGKGSTFFFTLPVHPPNDALAG